MKRFRKAAFLLALLPLLLLSISLSSTVTGQTVPTVSEIQPEQVTNVGETTLSIEGTGFSGIPAVSLPGVAELATTLIANTSLTALLPAEIRAGVYDVQITNGDGAQVTLDRALTVNGPTGVQPDSISNLADAELVITGLGFVDGAVVVVDGYGALTTTFVSASLLRALVPAGVSPGLYTIRVVNPDASASVLVDALTVRAPAATPEPTGTPGPTKTPVPTAFVRPVLVVQSYGASSPVITPGQDLDFEMTLANNGQSTATNIVANFTSGDFMPRVTGGVYAVGTLTVGQNARFWQPLSASAELAGKTTGVLQVKVTYTDVNGTAYEESFALTFPMVKQPAGGSGPTPTATPTPTPTATSAPRLRPQLLVDDYETDLIQLEPGSRFILSLNVRNQGNADARRVTMILGGGSSSGGSPEGTPEAGGGLNGAGGEFSNFAPVSASNVSFLGDLLMGDSLQAASTLIVNASTKPGAYPVVVSFVYNDSAGSNYVDEQVITILVYSKPAVEMNFYMEPAPLFAGQPGSLPLQLVNVGKSSTVFGNFSVSAVGAQLSNNSVFVGALEPGGFFPLDAMAIPDRPGMLELMAHVAYTDDFNQPQVLTRTLTLEVMEAPPVEENPGGPEGEGMAPSEPMPMTETLGQKVWRFVRGMVGLSSGPDQPEMAGVPGEMPGTAPPQDMPVDGPGSAAPYEQ